MKNLKLPRVVKKGLKKAVLKSIPNPDWKTSEVLIKGISTNYRFVKRKNAKVFNGIAVTSYSLG